MKLAHLKENNTVTSFGNCSLHVLVLLLSGSCDTAVLLNGVPPKMAHLATTTEQEVENDSTCTVRYR